MSNEPKDWVDEANAAFDEGKRVERWHATYNAALTGCHAFPGLADQYEPLDVQTSHEIATEAANLAHGKLKP